MELSYISLISALVVLVSLFLHVIFFKNKSSLPPGKYGWPILGESLDFLNAGRVGQPEKFIWDRIAKYSTSVFRTHLLGERMAVFCGAASNKFLYSNENKLVQVWWPSSYRKVFPTSVSQGTSEEESVKLKNMLPNFLKPEALHRYVSVMDDIAQRHFAEGWDGKEEVSVYPQAKEYTFWLVCRIFLRMEDDSHIKRFSVPFFSLAAGLAAVPIDLPGTPFRKSIRTADLIRKELVAIMKQRKVELAEGKASPTQDLLSYMMLHKDEDGKSMLELDIADKILGFIIAGHDSASSACAFVIKYLAELPEVYQGVYKEQMEIANSKKPGEGLNMEDIQKMKYSGNVISEVLRLAPPLQGAFREALTDFMYSGFSIPKGWKIYWSTHSTHRNPECFPNPTKFDPSRFEEKPAPFTYVPFGGGPRMCPGREYARMEILIFMHHFVKRFRVVKLIPDEKIVVDPLPVPAKGLPVRLYPHKA